jgi:DNA-binding NarL/FixJ family response regulator
MGTRERSAVLLDRHPLWLEAMKELVEGVGVDVVGRARDADEAVALIEEHRPDIFIAGLDVSTDDLLACLRRAREAHAQLRSVVVSDDAEPAQIESAFAAGASIFCARTAEHEDLASAIRQIFERSIYISGTTRIEPSQHPEHSLEADAPNLTRRELEILRLVAEGYSNAQLAKMLWVTEQTVKFHLSNIYRKLNVSNRTEAGRWAQLRGLLPEPGATAA